jgi:hypothetical protein
VQIVAAILQIHTVFAAQGIAQDEVCIAQDEVRIAQDEVCIAQDEVCIAQDEVCIAQDEEIKNNKKWVTV